MILKPHNQKAVDELTKNYKTCRTQIYISGVGTGKSYVFMGLADTLFKNKKILYIIPKYSVEENLKLYGEFEKLSKSVDFATFNSFTSVAAGLAMTEKHDFVLIDECHHLGSDRYGRNLVECMKQSHSYFLGITATPVRDADGVDVSSFFDMKVNGISNFEAISMGLMPPIEYRLGLPDKELKQLEKEYDNQIKTVVDYTMSESVIRDVTAMFPRNKWICFFSTAETLRSCESMIKRLFPEYKVFVLLSSLKNLNEVMNGVANAEKAIILSVNILLEGIHLSGIDGIILFRAVTSLSAFQQMIGRVCSIGGKVSPVVLDCSQSSAKLMSMLLSEQRGQGGEVRKRNPSVPGKEIVRIGVGAHIKYDIDELFKIVAALNENRLDERAKQATLKYQSFKGNVYETTEELKKNKVDYKKALACAKMYRTSIEMIIRTLHKV